MKNRPQNDSRRSSARRRWLIFVIRVVIGAVFIYASIDKITHLETFAKIIHNYRLLPPYFINLLAIILPWVEMVAGICLITGFKYRGATFIILFILAIFIIALSINYAKGVNIICGCFSTSSSSKSNLLWGIIEDVVLASGCIIILLRSKLRKQNSL